MSLTDAPPGSDLKSRGDRMADISKLLAAGLTAVSTIFAIVGVRDGGTGRILSNAPGLFFLAVTLVVLSVVLALASYATLTSPNAGTSAAWWLVLMVLALVAFAGSAAAILGAANVSASKFERPSLGVTVDENSVSVTASLPLLKATDTLTVVIFAFTDTSESPIQSEIPGDLLLRSTTGPDANGKATIESKARIPTTDTPYKVIEVRAYRNDVDPGCLDVKDPKKPAACVQVYLLSGGS